MKALVFEPFSGASGDMLIDSLQDAEKFHWQYSNPFSFQKGLSRQSSTEIHDTSKIPPHPFALA